MGLNTVVFLSKRCVARSFWYERPKKKGALLAVVEVWSSSIDTKVEKKVGSFLTCAVIQNLRAWPKNKDDGCDNHARLWSQRFTTTSATTCHWKWWREIFPHSFFSSNQKNTRKSHKIFKKMRAVKWVKTVWFAGCCWSSVCNGTPSLLWVTSTNNNYNNLKTIQREDGQQFRT